MDVLLETQPSLAMSICYVTSKFLPGGASTRDVLHPFVLRFLQDKFTNLAGPKYEEMATLKTLIILHAYAQPMPGLQSSSTSHMLPCLLIKFLTESYAVHLSLHRAVEDVKVTVRSQTNGFSASEGYKKYTYWLWLFTMAHQYVFLTFK